MRSSASTILAVVVAASMPPGRRTGTTNALAMSFAMGLGVPVQVLLIPLPFTVHLLTVFFTRIPHVLEEAAAIDGSRRRAHLRLDRAARHPRRAPSPPSSPLSPRSSPCFSRLGTRIIQGKTVGIDAMLGVARLHNLAPRG
ncbi:hypothetical protein ACFZDG_33130 [Kitasatospora xanthocidica]|uniref:hypothetical protein n=1 Tax=Kitasatospora xanthocidica TaxID=83382 RepID=UPI0036E09C3C